MAKLKDVPITQADLIQFLDEQSDFAFEIRTLQALIGCGFSCDHGGSYDDPATDKPREFDIRATKRFHRVFLRLAVECKNLHENYPLLISCLPRRKEEAFHEVVYSVNPETAPIDVPSEPYSLAMLPISKSIRLTGDLSLYQPGEPVGKSCDQVGRTSQGDLTSGDSGNYEKWAQALSSAADLTYMACTDGSERTGNYAMSQVLPIVVVPNGQLWVTRYDTEGNRTADPVQADRCSYYVGRLYYHRSVAGGDKTTISHLEFVTSDGLLKLVNGLFGDSKKAEQSLAAQHVAGIVRPRNNP